MKIVVVGTGGVGGYFGGRLAQSGEDVTFLARGNHLESIRRNGLRVDSTKGDFHIVPAKATDHPQDIGIADAILVAVKAWQVPEVAQTIKPMIGSDSFVVPLENGVEATEQLASVLGMKHVLGGLCKIISMIAGPGHIRHAGVEPEIAFAEWNNSPSKRAEKLKDAFEHAGVRVRIPSNIQTAIWEKFLFIAPVSGVGAVVRAPLGILRSVPETRKLLIQAMQEICDLAAARNVMMKEDALQRTLSYVDSMPPQGTASMQRDIQDGKPSELEAQNGAVVRLGKESEVLTPANEFIYASLLPSELKARGKITSPQ